jgi:HPt (histidine-containing phosphotransfer) domain-containing protein
MIEQHIEKNSTKDDLTFIDKGDISYSIQDTMTQLNLDEETASMLLENFFLTINEDVAILEKNIIQHLYNESYQQAHYIKGSCLNLALKELSSILETIEKKSQNNQDSSSSLEELKIKLEKIKTNCKI